ncbi:uncharacterized protein SOCE836_103830 [Sorangium cellulosum]|uniref:Uncharacterized protein n=1 Tax=Sorangium cellulosum TaxID=56 RepID=A0A4P2R7T4_SORCE|nr:uncharacterized protein SOCE836_103830 [Sorangium cellulosum]
MNCTSARSARFQLCSAKQAYVAVPKGAPRLGSAVLGRRPSRSAAFGRGSSGTIGPRREVLAQLGRDGNTERGRYFYAHIGVDIPLAGSVADTGDIALTELEVLFRTAIVYLALLVVVRLLGERRSGQITGSAVLWPKARDFGDRQGAKDAKKFQQFGVPGVLGGSILCGARQPPPSRAALLADSGVTAAIRSGRVSAVHASGHRQARVARGPQGSARPRARALDRAGARRRERGDP